MSEADGKKNNQFPVPVRKALGGFGSGYLVLPNQELSNASLEKLPATDSSEFVSLPPRVDPGVIGKVKTAKNKVRYWRWNPFSPWNRMVDRLTEEESWEHQREVHVQRWVGLGHAYRALFGFIFAMFKAENKPRYATFDDMRADQGIDDAELARLILVRKRQIVMFYMFMALPFLSSIFFAYHKMIWMFALNVFMFAMLGVLNLLFTVELWRLKNHRLGGIRQWLESD